MTEPIKVPTPRQKANNIVSKIFDDLNDRKGLHLDNLDHEIQMEIRKKWRDICMEEMAK